MLSRFEVTRFQLTAVQLIRPWAAGFCLGPMGELTTLPRFPSRIKSEGRGSGKGRGGKGKKETEDPNVWSAMTLMVAIKLNSAVHVIIDDDSIKVLASMVETGLHGLFIK